MSKLRTLLLVIVLTCYTISPVNSSIWDPFHTKEEKISMWKNLWETRIEANYESVGKTYLGNDIWMFKAGNPNGGCILLDGEIHGNEDKGSEILFLMAEWLLTSNEPQAERILRNNYVLFIPVLDFDRDARDNANYQECPYGVDLNRNFETGWIRTNPINDIYSGPYPLSEPETNVLRRVFEEYSPDFYINMHCGSGPVAFYSREGNTTIANNVMDRIKENSEKMGITPYPIRGLTSKGFSIGDAASFGASSWLIEVEGSKTAWKHSDELYKTLVDIYYPKSLAILISMCEYCEIEYQGNGDMNLDQRLDFKDIVLFMSAYQDFLYRGNINHRADLDNDLDIDFSDIVKFIEYYRGFVN